MAERVGVMTRRAAAQAGARDRDRASEVSGGRPLGKRSAGERVRKPGRRPRAPPPAPPR